MSLSDQERADMAWLMEQPAFRSFIYLRVIQSSGIYEATANGSAERTFRQEGRRSLGLEILRALDEAQPIQSPDGIPSLTMIQLHREAAQSPIPERTKSGRRSDPYADIRTDADSGAE